MTEVTVGVFGLVMGLFVIPMVWAIFKIKSLDAEISLLKACVNLLDSRKPSIDEIIDQVLKTSFYLPVTEHGRYYSNGQYVGTLKEIVLLLVKQAGIKYIQPTEGKLTIVSKDE